MSDTEPYLSGHYVPSGPRSKWSQAQYTVYKEEQAAWRLNRNENRLKGLEKRREEFADDPSGEKAKYRQMGGRYLQIDLDQDGQDFVSESFEVGAVPGIEYREFSQADEHEDHAGPESVLPCLSSGMVIISGSKMQMEPSALLVTSEATSSGGNLAELDEVNTGE